MNVFCHQSHDVCSYDVVVDVCMRLHFIDSVVLQCFTTLSIVYFVWRPALRALRSAAVIYQLALMCFSQGFSAFGKPPQSRLNPGGHSAFRHQGCRVVNHHSLNKCYNHPCWGCCSGTGFGWQPWCQLGLSQFQSQSAQCLTSGQSLDWVPN